MKLLVFVPALASTPASYGALVERLRADLGAEWQVKVFDHGIQPLSRKRMADVAYALAVRVRTWAGDNGIGERAEEVLLVGHSLGGLLVRHAYLVDSGAMGGQPRAYDWTSRVRRIVLLAAPNAGFRTEGMKWPHKLAFVTGAALGRFTVEELQYGSPYVTELRLRWVRYFRDRERPVVVQVLGDRDDVVNREDSLDVEYMPNAARIDVPGATHGSLVRVYGDDERYALLRRAVDGDVAGCRIAAQKPTGKPVYFLLHGIRAGNYANWVGRLADRLTTDESGAVVHAPSYGYLSAVEFAVPFTRSRNLRRFLDWYSRLYVTHGPDKLRFAGHSNGTYLLGRALLAVPAMRFECLYLAGSVLPREYPWSVVEARNQAGTVHTDRATCDVPVGWLCSALRGLGMRDVGTGGVDGFDEVTTIMQWHQGAFEGGHGAALEEDDRIAEVAAFLRTGETAHKPCSQPTALFGIVSRFAGVASRPAAVAGVAYAARWVVRAETPASRGRRLSALAAGAFGVVAVGRSV